RLWCCRRCGIFFGRPARTRGIALENSASVREIASGRTPGNHLRGSPKRRERSRAEARRSTSRQSSLPSQSITGTDDAAPLAGRPAHTELPRTAAVLFLTLLMRRPALPNPERAFRAHKH